jgi:hypothetical protein
MRTILQQYLVSRCVHGRDKGGLVRISKDLEKIEETYAALLVNHSFRRSSVDFCHRGFRTRDYGGRMLFKPFGVRLRRENWRDGPRWTRRWWRKARVMTGGCAKQVQTKRTSCLKSFDTVSLLFQTSAIFRNISGTYSVCISSVHSRWNNFYTAYRIGVLVQLSISITASESTMRKRMCLETNDSPKGMERNHG